MMDYKEETCKVYDLFPDYFDDKFGEYTNEVIKGELHEVILRFPKSAKILDLGSGPGNHALFFEKNGFDVLCLDISDKMLAKCKEKGLKTIKMDIEKLSFPRGSFDVIWAYTSLLHLPKSNLPKVLKKIKNILNDNGLFMISLKEGSDEGIVVFEKGGKRWFSCYTEKEIRELLNKDFKVLKNWRVSVSDKIFLDYLCIRR